MITRFFKLLSLLVSFTLFLVGLMCLGGVFHSTSTPFIRCVTGALCVMFALAGRFFFRLAKRAEAQVPAPAAPLSQPSQPLITQHTSTDVCSEVAWARRILANPGDYVLVDTETTGLDEHAQVIQIAIVDLTGKELLNSLIRPLNIKRMPARAKAKHGIGMTELKAAPTWIEAAQQINALLAGKIVLAYNASFDERLVLQTADLYGTIAPAPKAWECVMLPYSAFVGEPGKFKGEAKWQKLPGSVHGAAGDCQATLTVLRKMADGVRSLEPVTAPEAKHPMDGKRGKQFVCLYPDSKTRELVPRTFVFKELRGEQLLVIEIAKNGVPTRATKNYAFAKITGLREHHSVPASQSESSQAT